MHAYRRFSFNHQSNPTQSTMLQSRESPKSLWSRLSTSMYLFFHRRHQWKYTKQQTILAVISIFVFLIYGFLSLWIGLDIPYWIGHGIEYHRDHFQWSSSFEGDYCSIPRLSKTQTTTDGVNLWRLSHNNTASTKSRVLLLSYPRSGNHLTQAMLQCLLEIETYGYTKEKNDGPAQIIAIHNADAQKPYIRKIHTINATPKEFGQFVDDKDLGLIFLIRDPMESILSENKYVPPFWKDYEYQFGNEFMKLPAFYEQWKGDDSKLVIFYEDYFDAKDPYINLRKMADYFGEERVSTERLNQCIDHYKEVSNKGLKTLERTQTSDQDLHFYKGSYYGSDPSMWPQMRVAKELYELIFKRYTTIASC